MCIRCYLCPCLRRPVLSVQTAHCQANWVNKWDKKNKWIRRWMFPSWRHRGLIWANKRPHQAWPLTENGGSMAGKAMQSLVNCSQTQISHQPLFSLQIKGDGGEEKKKRREGLTADAWKNRVGLYCCLFSASSHQLGDNLSGSHLKMSCCLLSFQSIDEHYHRSVMAGGLIRGKNPSGGTKLTSLTLFPVASVPLFLDLAPDLWGGGLWVIARALPVPAGLWFVAEGSQLQPSCHFVQVG